MTRSPRIRATTRIAAAIAAAAASLAVCASAATAATLPAGYTLHVFASGAAPSLTGPDDITILNGVVYTEYQNDTKPDGSSGNATSTVVGYRLDGTQTGTWSVIGHADGLTADPSHHRLIVTVNEDADSSLYTIRPNAPAADQLQHYSYSPDPAKLSGGGTDAISVIHGRILISASAPSASTPGGSTYTAPAVFTAKVPEHGSVVTLSPTFYDNSQAKDALTGSPVALNLSDPDSNAVVPGNSPRFGGDFVLDSQGDSELIFARHPGTGDQSLTRLALTAPAAAGSGAPQVDDIAWTDHRGGTLLAVDAKQNQIDAISGPFARGMTLTAIPNDSPVLAGEIGTIDLANGQVSTFASGFASPKGLLYLPPSAGLSKHHGHRGSQGHQHHGHG